MESRSSHGRLTCPWSVGAGVLDYHHAVHRAMNELRSVAPIGGAYVSESNYFESALQHAYWDSNHARLAKVKKQYDPEGIFFVHNGVRSEQWTRDGFTRR